MDLKAVLALLDGEGTNEEKADKIFAAHKADKEPLERSKDKILSEKKDLQAKLEELSGKADSEREASEARIKELEDEVGNAGTEEAKKAFDAQLSREIAKHEAEKKKLATALEEANGVHSTLLERRRKDLVGLALEGAMTKAGITDPDYREIARKTFLFDHGASFKPGDDDETPVNTDCFTVSEVFEKLVSTTPAYQKFIPAKNNGGGATGSTGTKPPTANPFTKGKDWNLTEQGRIVKENPTLAARLKAEAGTAS